MLPQEELIARVRELSLGDERLVAVLIYGSSASRQEIEELCGRFANWLLLAHHVARRGELLRAVDALGHVRRDLLWMVRIAEDRTRHWLTPSRRAEIDLPSDVVEALCRTVGDAGSVHQSIAEAWACGRDYWQRLAGPVPGELFAEMDAEIRWTGDPGVGQGVAHE